MDAVWRLLQTTTSTTSTSTSQSQESEEIKTHHADTARNEETEEEEQEQQISSQGQEQQEQQQLQQLQQLERFLQEVTEEDLLRFRNQELQHIEEETLALLELQKMLHTLVQEQGEDLQVVEENVGDAEQDTKEAVFTLAKASRINAASCRLKSILWGAGLGSGLGAVAGGALGLVGTPVAALIRMYPPVPFDLILVSWCWRSSNSWFSRWRFRPLCRLLHRKADQQRGRQRAHHPPPSQGVGRR
ncbi:Mitochondrial distribution and morphology protein 12, variant 2 [Balamuthia mandrillaris]